MEMGRVYFGYRLKLDGGIDIEATVQIICIMFVSRINVVALIIQSTWLVYH